MEYFVHSCYLITNICRGPEVGRGGGDATDFFATNATHIHVGLTSVLASWIDTDLKSLTSFGRVISVNGSYAVWYVSLLIYFTCLILNVARHARRRQTKTDTNRKLTEIFFDMVLGLLIVQDVFLYSTPKENSITSRLLIFKPCQFK